MVININTFVNLFLLKEFFAITCGKRIVPITANKPPKMLGSTEVPIARRGF